MGVREHLGENVKSHNGDVPVAELFKNKVIGLYFSAHWCPPCKGFTPTLDKWYNDIKDSDKYKGKLELVFVSLDRDQAAFEDYWKSMTFLAMDYSKERQKLAEDFSVSGIPCLIFIDDKGDVITKEGRGIVTNGTQDKDLHPSCK